MSGPGLDRAWGVLRRRGPGAAALAAVGAVTGKFEQAWKQRRGPQQFLVDGVRHTQLVHPYNRTWRNERAVEVPLAEAFLDRVDGPVLELGNVLANYGRSGHVVVDKYELKPGVRNVDVVDYRPEERFGAIVALSTLEHVGWDEEARDPAKIPRAVQHLRHLLLPTGRLLVTCPLSYNPHLDALISADALGADTQAYLVKHRSVWTQVERASAFAGAGMGRYGGSALWIAEFPP